MVHRRGDSCCHLTCGSYGNDSTQSILLLVIGPQNHVSGLSHCDRLLQTLPTHLFSCHFVTCLENLLLMLFIHYELLYPFFGQTACF